MVLYFRNVKPRQNNEINRLFNLNKCLTSCKNSIDSEIKRLFDLNKCLNSCKKLIIVITLESSGLFLISLHMYEYIFICKQAPFIPSLYFWKLGYLQNATQNCPIPFLGSFVYSFDDGSSTSCDCASMWVTDRTQMVVNYTLCSTKQFYSSKSLHIMVVHQ